MVKKWVTFQILIICWLCFGTVQLSGAWTGRIPERTTRQITHGVKSWRFAASNTPGVGASITSGSRKDTARVTRVIAYGLQGNERNVQLDIEKRIVLRYEVFVKGPKAGKLYRFYQPTAVTVSKTCRYLRVFRLTTSAKTTLLDYGVTKRGCALTHFAERTTFTLPQQFPMRRDGLTQLLRSAFKIDFGNHISSYLVEPNGSFGQVSVSY